MVLARSGVEGVDPLETTARGTVSERPGYEACARAVTEVSAQLHEVCVR